MAAYMCPPKAEVTVHTKQQSWEVAVLCTSRKMRNAHAESSPELARPCQLPGKKRCIWHRRSNTLAKTGKSQQQLSTGKWKSSNTCDGSSPEPLAELPAPLGLGVFFPGDLTGPGKVVGVKEIRQ